MTTPPPESVTPLVTPTLEETRAITSASSQDEIRALAQQLLKAMDLGFNPVTYLKAIVTGIDHTGSPPTVSVQVSGDTTTTISGVRLMNDYSPQIGHTVLVKKQGSDVLVEGHVAELSAYSTSSGAGGWIKASLSAGSHNGNSNGDVCYRRVLEDGSWKMQWRGGWNVSGTTMITGLQEEYRPSSKRSVLCARHIQTGAVAAQFDFLDNGNVTLVGNTQSALSAAASGDVWSNDPNDSTTSVDPIDSTTSGGTDGHTHGVVGSHSHGVVGSHDHGFTGGSHTHPVDTPDWVSLHGCEYFL